MGGFYIRLCEPICRISGGIDTLTAQLPSRSCDYANQTIISPADQADQIRAAYERYRAQEQEAAQFRLDAMDETYELIDILNALAEAG